MVGSVPEPLGQSSNELFIDEPHCFQGYLAQSLMQAAGNWQVRPCSQEPWAAWGFGVPDSIIQDVRQAGAAASPANFLETQFIRPYPRLIESESSGIGPSDLCFNKSSR